MYKASEDIAALNTIPVLGYSVQTFSEVSYYFYFFLFSGLLKVEFIFLLEFTGIE